MKHILMLVDNHVRDDPRVMPEAISLVEAGYAVTVVGLGLRRDLPTRDAIRGVNIILAPMAGLMLNPIAVTKGVLRWLRGDTGIFTAGIPEKRIHGLSFLTVWLWTLRLALPTRADAVHCHDAPLLAVGWLYSQLRRVPLVYDSHENAAFISGTLRRQLIPRIEKLLIRHADAVITVGERLAAALRERGAKRVIVIGNWKRLEEFLEPATQLTETRQTLDLNSQQLTVSYIGLLERARGVETLVEAVAQTPDVQLIIAGSGSLADWVGQTAENTSNIHWLGWISRTDVPVYTRLSDVIYYCIEANEGNFYYSTPNKLFEAFAAGKALIVRRGFGEIGEILETIPAAVLLEEITVETLKDAFAQLQEPAKLTALQAAALAARSQYNWAVGEQRLKDLYSDLLESH